MSAMGEMTFRTVPAHFNQANQTQEDMKVAVLNAGLANQEYSKKQRTRFIFKTIGLQVLVALIKTLVSCELLTFLLTRA